MPLSLPLFLYLFLFHVYRPKHQKRLCETIKFLRYFSSYNKMSLCDFPINTQVVTCFKILNDFVFENRGYNCVSPSYLEKKRSKFTTDDMIAETKGKQKKNAYTYAFLAESCCYTRMLKMVFANIEESDFVTEGKMTTLKIVISDEDVHATKNFYNNTIQAMSVDEFLALPIGVRRMRTMYGIIVSTIINLLQIFIDVVQGSRDESGKLKSTHTVRAECYISSTATDPYIIATYNEFSVWNPDRNHWNHSPPALLKEDLDAFLKPITQKLQSIPKPPNCFGYIKPSEPGRLGNAKVEAEADAKARAWAQYEADAKAQADAYARAKAEADARAKAESDAKAKESKAKTPPKSNTPAKATKVCADFDDEFKQICQDVSDSKCKRKLYFQYHPDKHVGKPAEVLMEHKEKTDCIDTYLKKTYK